MPDLLYRGRLAAYDIAFAYTVCTDTVQEAVRRHDCDPVSAHVLSRAMGAAVLAASSLPPGERLNARWAYEGALRTVVVDTGPDGATRGFVSPTELVEAAETGPLYGESGQVSVIRSRGGVVSASGTSKADLLDVVDDFAFFLCVSDQVESAATVMVGFTQEPERPVRVCRGLLLQALPGSDLARFQRLREHLDGESVRAQLSHGDETDNLFENALNLMCRDEDEPPRIEFADAPPPFFQCTCSREKMGAVLRAVPIPERMDMVRKKEDVVVGCRFCNARYTLTVEDCIRLWNEKV